MRTTTEFAVDTSVAVPLLLASHSAHRTVSGWARGQTLHLLGHALAETYAVLTRLPGDSRLAVSDAVALIDDSFETEASTAGVCPGVHRELARLGIAGGASYDGLVALAARDAGLPLATRDARARATYEAIGVTAVVVTGSRQ